MNADGQGRDRTGDLPLQMAAGIVLLVGSVGQAQEDLRQVVSDWASPKRASAY
jgi:hypothetical protein